MNPETIKTPEQYSSMIELRFMRHDEKEKDPTKDDTEIRLTPAGKMNAKSVADLITNSKELSQTMAFGSPRKRAQETAGLAMAGSLDLIEGTESLEELKGKLNEGLKYGSKILADKRLDFILAGDSEYAKQAMEAFKKGLFLRFLVDQSDELAERTGDHESSTYSREAAGIAQIVAKYIKVSERFDRLVNDPSKNYEKKMRRLFGTHQTLQECFLAKVIEKVRGVEGREEFLSAVGTAGFGFSEGFECEIITLSEGEKKVRVIYRRDDDSLEKSYLFDEVVPIETIQEIAAGR